MVIRKRRKIMRKKIKSQNKKIVIFTMLLICFFAVGYGAFETVVKITASGHIVFDERCIVGNVFNFTQKDEIQEFKVPCSGTYKLETWGASGGDALDLQGGYGGYSVGNIDLKVKQKLYVVVGGEGETSQELEKKDDHYIVRIYGGYNGGGIGTSGQCGDGTRDSHFRYGSSGGGATHIAKETGLLSNLSNSINNIYIVSGGGGGAFTFKGSVNAYGLGSSSGGQIGNTAYFTLVSHTKTHYAEGGTQESSGINGNSYNDDLTWSISNASFGSGAQLYGGYCAEGSGGGSGLYGGGACAFGPGAGGSSYIGNVSLKDKAMYCYDCEESLDLTKPDIFTISTTGETNYRDTLNCPDGYDENPVSKCAKEGDGYARITLVSKK